MPSLCGEKQNFFNHAHKKLSSRCALGWNVTKSTRRVLGHSLVRSLVCSHRLLARSQAHEKEDYTCKLSALSSLSFNSKCVYRNACLLLQRKMSSLPSTLNATIRRISMNIWDSIRTPQYVRSTKQLTLFTKQSANVKRVKDCLVGISL